MPGYGGIPSCRVAPCSGRAGEQLTHRARSKRRTIYLRRKKNASNGACVFVLDFKSLAIIFLPSFLTVRLVPPSIHRAAGPPSK